ncbi:(2Fe-2S)-binding protein [Novosphingobium umbonatum]|uniref:(2Fe-2S)-binding protein n=1 Tax=Novosphingobium umbonatum TaxID=1908524 RepID=A0A437NBE2_9SPHN|nr:(2Fe-2S)-binding protein [Novosphingobium umbonatum]RVU07172.1 (2Fe-2S)-binding protein [Novosphingobium umbonatum]
MTPRFKRLVETDRPAVSLTVDGRAIKALAGDTLMVAMLTHGDALRTSEFASLEPGDGRRAGFCLMSACQDCWVWTADGHRLRACSTPVEEGMAISTSQPEASWASLL